MQININICTNRTLNEPTTDEQKKNCNELKFNTNTAQGADMDERLEIDKFQLKKRIKLT